MIGLDQAAVNERARLAPDREGTGVSDLLQVMQQQEGSAAATAQVSETASATVPRQRTSQQKSDAS
jgi:hypothetical protein